jgi:hypothetical protein
MVAFVFVLAPIGASPSNGALSFYALPVVRGRGAYDLHPGMLRQKLRFARSTVVTEDATADRRAVIVPILCDPVRDRAVGVSTGIQGSAPGRAIVRE